ncbi:MAG: DUF2878 domain-containing protein [Pseudomonadota bacterium]
MPYLIANFALFQASWVALVAGAANGLLIPGVLLTAAFLCWELRRSDNPSGLALLVALAVVGGIVVDGGYALSGVVDYELPAGPLAPWWILGLWVVFSLTLTESMGWMRDRRVIGSLLAGVSAPLSYYAGYKLGAVEFPRGLWFAMGVAAVTWIPAIFALVTLSNRLLPKKTAAPA